MTRSRIRSGALLVVGAAILVVQAARQPSDTVLLALAFVAAWWIRHRLVRRPAERRRHLRHVRRHVATATLVTAAFWTAIVFARLMGQTSDTTVSNVVDDPDPRVVATDADSDPWPGWNYVDGIVTVVALAMLSGGAMTIRSARRERRRRAREAAMGPATLPHEPTLSADR